MPEIWIPYGDVEISVDIDANNLSGIFKTDENQFDLDELNDNKLLTNIEERISIIDICNSTGSLLIIEKLIEIMNKKNNDYQIEMIIKKNQKRNIEGLFKDKKLQHNIKFIEDLSNKEIIEQLNNIQTILLSNSSFDGLFGFSGGAISLAKILDKELVNKRTLFKLKNMIILSSRNRVRR